MRSEVGDAQVPGVPIGASAAAGLAPAGDAEQRRPLAHGEIGQEREFTRIDVPVLDALHVARHALADGAQPQRAVHDRERALVLGERFGEPRFLGEHRVLECVDEVARCAGGRLDPCAKAQPRGAYRDLVIARLPAALQVDTIDSQPISGGRVAVQHPGAGAFAAHRADRVRAEQPECSRAIGEIIDRVRIHAAHAVDDLYRGRRVGRRAHRLPRALHGGIDLDRRIVVVRLCLGLDAAAVLGRPGKQAQRHRGNLARARGDENECRGVHAV